MSKRWWLWTVLGACGIGLAFLLIYWVLALFLATLYATVVLVTLMSRDWDRHSTFEERELIRAERRAAKYERTAMARARDRARWEAHEAKKAAGN